MSPDAGPIGSKDMAQGTTREVRAQAVRGRGEIGLGGLRRGIRGSDPSVQEGEGHRQK